MNLQQLSSHAHAGRIDLLELISIEGGFYLLKAQMHGTQQLLMDEAERPLRLRSVEQARRALVDLPRTPFFLVHHSAHDEMCGLANDPHEPMRIPIPLNA